MSKELALAKYYIELSNQSDLLKIEKLFDEHSTFRTSRHEYFVGVDNIMRMQRKHHNSFKELHWHINAIHETKPGVISIEFNFEGVDDKNNAEQLSGKGVVVVYDGMIRHIDISHE